MADSTDITAQRDALAAALRRICLALQQATGEDLRTKPIGVLVSRIADLGAAQRALAARVLELEGCIEQVTDGDGQPLGPGAES